MTLACAADRRYSLARSRLEHARRSAAPRILRADGRETPPALASAAPRSSTPPSTACARQAARTHLPRGLLARAAYHRDAGNDKLASEDLTEAFEIAERGGMRLFLADCWLESARQRLAKPNADPRNG